MTIISEWNEDCAFIGHYKLPFRGMIGDLDQAFEIGVDDYITKLSDLMQLGKIVKTKWEKYTKPSEVR